MLSVEASEAMERLERLELLARGRTQYIAGRDQFTPCYVDRQEPIQA